MRPIIKLQSVHIQTPVFDDTVAFYTESFGLCRMIGDSRRVSLAGAHRTGKALEISKGDPAGLVGLTLAMASDDDLAQSKTELIAQGIAIEVGEGTDDDGASFSIRDPDGHRVTFVSNNRPDDMTPTEDGRPLFISHVVLNSPQQSRLMSFYTDVLGFKVADRYENDTLVFLRCAQPQHHCIGISPGAAPTLNHFSLEVGSIDSLMKSVGRMQKRGLAPIWGPGRHGPGGNVFCYYEDPNGLVPEFTCDVIQIQDEATWVAKEWPRVPDIANVWGTGGPSVRAIDLMSGRNGR